MNKKKRKDVCEVVEDIKKELFDRENYHFIYALNLYTDYPKLEFGIDALSITDIHNFESISSNDEIVLAVLKGRNKITDIVPKVKVIITDKAIYLNDDVVKKNCEEFILTPSGNRVDLDALIGGILCQIKGESEVALVGPKFIGRLTVSTPIDRIKNNDISEKSLCKFLLRIQEAICINNDEINCIDNKLDWFISVYKRSLYEGLYNNLLDDVSIICRVGYGYKGKAIYLFKPIVLLNDYMLNERLNLLVINEDEADGLLLEIRKLLIDYANELECAENCRTSKFDDSNSVLASFENRGFSYQSSYGEVKRRIVKLINDFFPRINLDLCLKNNEYSLSELLKYSEQNCIKRSKADIVKMTLFLRNNVMSDIWNKIKASDKYDEEWINRRDAFGFNALHYGILLDNKKLTRQLAKRHDELPMVTNDDIDFYCAHEYSFLCAFLKKYDFETYFEFVCNTPELEVLLRTKKKLETKRDVYQSVINRLRSRLTTMDGEFNKIKRRTDSSSIKFKEYSGNYYTNRDVLRRQINSKMICLRLIEEYFKDIYYEIEDATKRHFIRQCEYVDTINIKSSRGFFYTCYFYKNCENVSVNLGVEWENFVCEELFGEWFQVPNDLKEKWKTVNDENSEQYYEQSHESRQNSQTNFTGKGEKDNKKSNQRAEKHDNVGQTINKPFGNSWFSPEAHSDMKVLRKEYNVLAKRFHPDNDPNGAEIFISIQEERCKIIDGL